MPNRDLVKQFGGKLLGIYTGAVLTKLIDVGYQLGLFEAAKKGAATSSELAERAGLTLDGKGLGTVWGEQLARQYLTEAGFGNVTVLDSPRPQNSIFVARH